ncbi:hypothetical protein MAM1_0349c09920 [Mucor ambiguus]|uniref:Uncharacterized protein n=1 Tax=Mucor ambiguus TaxID=91626 RepID=A0A0C9LXR7_9FUNG|nr:hypothetical protein MAM1_0349c09920 [Mucor ambiguus]
MLCLGKLLLSAAAAVAVYLLSWCLDARCCCNCRSLAVLAMLSFGNLALFAAAVAVYLLSWCFCLVGACFCCLLSFTCCLGAVYCCCCRSFIIAVLVMHSLGKLVQHFTSAVAVYLLSWRLIWCYLLLLQASTVGCVGDDALSWAFFCYCCRLFAVLVTLYRVVNLVLSAAAANNIYY